MTWGIELISAAGDYLLARMPPYTVIEQPRTRGVSKFGNIYVLCRNIPPRTTRDTAVSRWRIFKTCGGAQLSTRKCAGAMGGRLGGCGMARPNVVIPKNADAVADMRQFRHWIFTKDRDRPHSTPASHWLIVRGSSRASRG